MSFEFLQKKQTLLSELMEAVNTIERVLPSLSDDERQSLLEGLRALLATTPAPILDAGAGRAALVPNDVPEIKYPPPARAVEMLLANTPTGLFAGDIVTALEGKIQTSSEQPRDVIYSAVAFLKKKKVITQLPDKRYILTEKKDGHSESIPF